MSTNASIWEAALKVESEARDIAERFYNEDAKPVFDAHDAGAAAYAAVLEREEGYDTLTSVHYDTLKALFITPAPTLEAVAVKLRMGCADCFFDGSKASFEVLSAIAGDVERLSREASHAR
ncbi:hypothetical protein [Novosphingobium subterraneum]|uniref:Uncharacterized protein n=1 Tax=Novosphingobium subterraneum TaxID=48936 RepID=A0A0B8ZAW7_9SPHN|nr:hypothetical protein [Novosphingobium subterraneum]KHS43403.1 hypothetical protein NJ75_03712 [Novosphingobium subterraneum]